MSYETGINVMQEEMDKEMKRLESRLAKEYKQAEKELTKRADDYFARFAERDKQMSKKVADGQMSMDDYINWRTNKILYGENLKAQIDQMSEYLASVNQQAMDVVNGRAKGVYAHNYNFGKYEVEKGFGINTSFTLFDDRSVVRLARKNPRLLPNLPPDKMVDIPKDKRWSKRKINNVITQGILQGKPIPKIASDLSSVVGMEKRAAIRNARTAMTGAQNAGRLDSYTHSKALGIKLKKQWMATLDERTRTSHQELDGELAEVDKKFSNGLMFPADPDGKPAEVYNCRCTMVAELDDYPSEKFERYDNIDGKPIENCTYNEWAAAKFNKTKAAGKTVREIKTVRFSDAKSATEYFRGSTYESKLTGKTEVIKDKTKPATKWEEKLTGNQVRCISDYTGNTYEPLNEYLRGVIDKKEARDAIYGEYTVDQYIKNIDAAIKKYDLKEPITVYRTCESEFVDQLEVGSEFHDKGYGSTSVLDTPVASGNVHIEIQVPSGKGVGAYVDGVSWKEGEEYEFLLGRGANYYVLNKEERNGEIYVKAIITGFTKE